MNNRVKVKGKESCWLEIEIDPSYITPFFHHLEIQSSPTVQLYVILDFLVSLKMEVDSGVFYNAIKYTDK
jgi:hypothetical protein